MKTPDESKLDDILEGDKTYWTSTTYNEYPSRAFIIVPRMGAIGHKGDLDLDGDIDGLDLSEFAEIFGTLF